MYVLGGRRGRKAQGGDVKLPRCLLYTDFSWRQLRRQLELLCASVQCWLPSLRSTSVRCGDGSLGHSSLSCAG